MKRFFKLLLPLGAILFFANNLALSEELGAHCSPTGVLNSLFTHPSTSSEANVQKLVSDFDQRHIQNKLSPEQLTKLLTVKEKSSGNLLGTYYRPRKEVVEKIFSKVNSGDAKIGKTFTTENTSWLKKEKTLDDMVGKYTEALTGAARTSDETAALPFLNRYLYEIKNGDLTGNEASRLANQFIPRPSGSGVTDNAWNQYLNDSHDFFAANTKEKALVSVRYQKHIYDNLGTDVSFNKYALKRYLEATDTPSFDKALLAYLPNASNGALLKDIFPSALALPQDQTKTIAYLESLFEKNKPEINKNIEAFYQKNFATLTPLSAQHPSPVESFLQKKLPALYHESLVKFVNTQDLKNLDHSVSKVIASQQAEIETGLKKQMQHVLEANAPPPPWDKSPQSWAGYVNELPLNLREEFTYQLLKKNGTYTENFTRVVSKLDPTEGVRDAVARFLRDSDLMGSNRTSFSQDEIKRMFGNGRFKKFFPWMPNEKISSATRTQFSVAVYTNPKLPANQGLNLAWFREKVLDNDIASSIPEIVGFRPALNYERMITQLTDNFSGSLVAKNPTDQIRGLVVQGEYEKNGSSFMVANRNRGDLQVEEIAPRFSRQLENNLNVGNLKNADPLDRRLFVQNWALAGSDSNLIESIRAQAIQLENLPNFWSIRVDIHNFPTAHELARVRAYLGTFKGDQATRDVLTSLASNLERFLGIDQKTGASIHNVIDKLKMNDESKTILKSYSEHFDQLPAPEKLTELEKIRKKYIELKSNGGSTTKMTEVYLGEKTFSDQAALISNDYLAELKTSGGLKETGKVTQFASRLMNHLEMDNVLEPSQIHAINQNLENILKNSSLASERKLELVSDVLENTVDQVYYKFLNRYGDIDNHLFRVRGDTSKIPTRFLDSQMRKGPTFILSKLTDELKTTLSEMKNLSYDIGGEKLKLPVQVYNPGHAVGILRINKSPLQLSKEEIGVFSEMPTEMSPAAGMVTLGTGARLSHVQLLAKSLGIPNAKLSVEYLEHLKKMEGKLVRFVADKEGNIAIHEYANDLGKIVGKDKKEILIPTPDHRVQHPISFAEINDANHGNIAGPKGINLSKLYQNSTLNTHVPDGFILPFGYFKKYSDEIGLTPLLDLLSSVKLENKQTVVALTSKIQQIIQDSKISDKMLDEVMHSLGGLKERTQHSQGYFFRSDTHIEDLEGFNAAGLNESVPNVLIDKKAVDEAIRRVWQSPFSEKSIYWRGMALQKEQVTIAEPSVVVMPTVQAASSGVILSKGTEQFIQGKGKISANWGIGSVVESGRPVEEISLEANHPIHYSLTVSDSKPVAKASGGLEKQAITPGLPVLSESQIQELNLAATQIEKTLGVKPYGYDIEWAYDSHGKLIILQARPNMP